MQVGIKDHTVYAKGLGRTGMDLAIIMKHKAKSTVASTSKSNEMWYMDFEASNHMMNHKEWFSTLVKPEQLGVVETVDDTPHPIEHIRDVSLSHIGQRGIFLIEKKSEDFSCFLKVKSLAEWETG